MNAQQLAVIAQSVLEQFGEPGALQRSAGTTTAPRLEHFIRIMIGEQGLALFIGAEDRTVEALAARMFDRPTTELRQTDWVDALGELGNMLAGKLEGVLRSSGGLSIPSYFNAAERPAIWQIIKIEAEVWSFLGVHPIYFAVGTVPISRPLN